MPQKLSKARFDRNCAAIRLKASVCDSTRFARSTQNDHSSTHSVSQNLSSAGFDIRLKASLCDSMSFSWRTQRGASLDPHVVPTACFGRKFRRNSFGGIGMRFYEILLKKATTTIARATGCPRSSRGHVSTGNCAVIRLKASVCDSTRFDLRTQRRP